MVQILKTLPNYSLTKTEKALATAGRDRGLTRRLYWRPKEESTTITWQ